MSAKCYAKGSTSPPNRKPGDLRVYSMRFCPYAKRVLLVLEAKKIPYETVNINLDAKPEWYLDMYPSGKVPVLESDGVFLSESLIISEYLDSVYPGDALTPVDAYERAKQKMLLDVTFSKVTSSLLKAVMKPEIAKEAFEESSKAFAELEAELKKKNTPYFSGNRPGMLDFMMWPWFEILPYYHHRIAEEYTLDLILPKDKFPLLNCWMEELLQWPAVKKLNQPANLSLFLKSAKTGKVRDFDAGL